MDIVVLVGSIRKDSYNMRVAKVMQARYKDKLNIDIADIGALPHYDQDEELNPPQVVVVLKEAIAKADGVIVITPEYNWSIPGVLKNAFDWASRGEKVFIGKPVMTLGATPGMLGTVRAQLHLRDILAAPGVQAHLLPPGGNEVLIGAVHEKFDEQTGQLVDEATLSFLDSKIDAFIDHIKSVADK